MNDLVAPPQPSRIEDIFGFFPQVTTTPTWTPKTLRDSIALNTSTSTIYYYDFTNNSWRSSFNASYAGLVGVSASGNTLPTGWSASYSGGVYTVTHNLGNASYYVSAVPMGAGAYSLGYRYVNQIVINANTFVIQIVDAAGLGGNPQFAFTLTMIT